MSYQVQGVNALFQLAGVGVVQTDLLTGRFMRVNDTFCEMVGYSQDELKGMTNAELTHPEEWIHDDEQFKSMQRGELKSVQSVTRCIRKDGKEIWLELHVTIIGESDHAINIAVVNDITKRREADAKLNELNETLEQRVKERTEDLARSEQRFSQAFNANPISATISTLGKGEIFLDTNEAFLRLTGYSREEIIGKDVFSLGMWSSTSDQRKLKEAQKDQLGFRDLELHLRHKDGTPYDVLLSADVIRLDGHEGYLKMFYDITERKRTEAQMHQAIQSLMNDASWFSREFIARLNHIRAGGDSSSFEQVALSRRERQVLECIAAGWDNKRISEELKLKLQTVRNYITHLYEKIGVHNRAEAVVWARERGIQGR